MKNVNTETLQPHEIENYVFGYDFDHEWPRKRIIEDGKAYLKNPYEDSLPHILEWFISSSSSSSPIDRPKGCALKINITEETEKIRKRQFKLDELLLYLRSRLSTYLQRTRDIDDQLKNLLVDPESDKALLEAIHMEKQQLAKTVAHIEQLCWKIEHKSQSLQDDNNILVHIKHEIEEVMN